MSFQIKTCMQLILLMHQVASNWRLVDQSFTELQMISNNWEINDRCFDSLERSINYQTCTQNYIQYVLLDDDRRYIYKSFNYKSYQAQVIFDAYFDDADNDVDSSLKVSYDSNKDSESEQLLYRRNYKQSDLNQNSVRICHSTWRDFEFYTVVSTIANSNTNQFKIKICFNPRRSRVSLGINNLLIYQFLPSNLFNLQWSYRNIMFIIVQGGKCQCIPDQQFSETYIGCLQECSRDYSIADYDKICVNDKRIRSKFTLFESESIPQSNQRYYPLIFEKDEFNPRNSDLIYENCNGISFIGKLYFNEGFLYQMSLENAIKFIRIRITFYLFNFQETSTIYILHNNRIQSRIIKGSSDFQVDNLVKIFEKNENCGSIYTLLRIEMTFQLFNSNPTILIKGYLQQEYESWGLRNITVDTGFCQENCLICLDFSTCTQCDTTYKLYQNKCVQNCPIHSSNCIDYEEIIPYSRYLAKGFYDLNMTLDEIQQFYDYTTDPSFSLSTKQKFSFLNNKIVLGGLLVWNDGSYIKTWIIQKPHYAATIYFNLTYGDTYTGSFYYKIGSTSSIGFQGLFNNPGGGQNLIGRTGLESIRFFNVSLTNFYTNNLYIEFKCDVINTNITKEFCAISEYFIVIHHCPPFCSSCTSLNTCSDVGYTGPNCGNNQYLDFDSSIENYSCKNCNQPGCNTCTSIEECTQCVNNQFILINGICLCNPFTFLQGNNCIQCNKYCENCYGDSQYNCLTCVKDHHRSIQRNQCLCLTGYYDDGNNLPCFPICGDQIIVGEEECDDGNIKDDDGCVDCQIKCQVQCTLCELDICKECNVEGWQLSNQKCIPICGDQLVLGLEECDDGNMIPYDGCYECKFQCLEQCAQCENGICKACIKPGWILNQYNICTTQCGDGIVVDPYEQCDDGNDIPYDGCYWCEFQCTEGCIECQQQQCKKCDYLYKLNIQTAQCIKENYYDNNDNNQDVEKSNLQLIFYTNFRCGENYNLIDNLCISQCGNGILINKYEECDDGNNYGGDGCSAYCHIEDSYTCINQEGSLSLCTYIIAPKLNLNILSDNAKQIKIVELTFTQQVKLEESLNFEEIIVFSIFPQTRYQLTISCISNLTITLSDPKYQIQIEFIEQIQNPILQVDIQKNTIFNTYDLGLLENKKTINLGTPFVLSQTTKQQLINIVQLNDVMMYSMVGVSSLAFLTGNAIMFLIYQNYYNNYLM
ncbi:unnamed protein product [Paramecium primaurelia]|uniref:Insulin-like growth factor binding protein, N-terminal n=1 Tax=Paramecium primaurelia TaxID=5886 RepID=A0A8S1NE92_PARPR|nr:unnamed protein product [Paramecium primaurelia]